LGHPQRMVTMHRVANLQQLAVPCRDCTGSGCVPCPCKCSGLIVLQAVVDLVDALEAAAAGKSKDERHQLCLHEGQILQWLRNKLPTNADLGQVSFCGLHAAVQTCLSVLLCIAHSLCRWTKQCKIAALYFSCFTHGQTRLCFLLTERYKCITQASDTWTCCTLPDHLSNG